MLESVADKRRTTIADVAQAAGVSRTTVSYVLSGRVGARVPDTTRRRIVEAAERVGYRRNALAVGLRSGRMNTIGIVAPFSLMSEIRPAIYSGVYYKDLLLATAAALLAAGQNPLLLSEEVSHKLSLADITDRRADGVILITKSDAEAFVREAASAHVPCVSVGREFGAWQVHTDNRIGAKIAVDYLLSLGHRRIGYLWYGKEQVFSARERRDGFRSTLNTAGIADTPEFSDSHLDVLVSALHGPDRLTAVFCYNDELATLLLDACRDAGIRVPEEVSIVGFDDNVLAVSARPRLTTVHSPLTGLATTAVEMLLAQLRGEKPPPAPVYIPPALVIRDSTAPPVLPMPLTGRSC